jgi:Restriction endonuclease AspBHI N-terminal
MNTSLEYNYEDLPSAKLLVGALYKNDPHASFGGHPLGKIGLLGQNVGGFRFNTTAAYCILTYTGEKAYWPDCVDPKSGIVHYYGDNHGNKGGELLSTRGNFFLHQQHQLLKQKLYSEMKVFLVFEGIPRAGFVFRGLAVMGMPSGRTEDCLQIVKATLDDGRVVDNYHVTLTLLDIPELSRSDLALLNNGQFPNNGVDYPLQEWRKHGVIKPLKRP